MRVRNTPTKRYESTRLTAPVSTQQFPVFNLQMSRGAHGVAKQKGLSAGRHKDVVL